MNDVALRDEMHRLLADPPFGGLAELARAVGVSGASVSAWKQGHSRPIEEHLPAIERFLGLPEGHLERATLGDLDESVQAAWPEIQNKATTRRISRRDDELVALRRQLAALNEGLDRLGATVEGLADEVAQLRAQPPRSDEASN